MVYSTPNGEGPNSLIIKFSRSLISNFIFEINSTQYSVLNNIANIIPTKIQNEAIYCNEIQECSKGGSSGIVGNVGDTIEARTGGTEFILSSIDLNPLLELFDSLNSLDSFNKVEEDEDGEVVEIMGGEERRVAENGLLTDEDKGELDVVEVDVVEVVEVEIESEELLLVFDALSSTVGSGITTNSFKETFGCSSLLLLLLLSLLLSFKIL